MTVLAVAGLPSATTSVGPWNSATATGLDSDLAQGANPRLCEEGLTARPGAAPERDLVRLLRLKEGSDHRPGGAGPLAAGERELMGEAPEVLRVLALGVRCGQGEEARRGGGAGTGKGIRASNFSKVAFGTQAWAMRRLLLPFRFLPNLLQSLHCNLHRLLCLAT